MHIHAGEVVALLGPNGAGKTTTVRTIAGELPACAGTLRYQGRMLRGPLHRRARAGIATIPEERAIFSRLSTLANLRLGRGDVEAVLELFPELEPLLDRRAGLLSGGEQQMLVVGRAIAANPKLLLVDELSLGLAPLVVERLLRALRRAAGGGTAVLLIEQHARKALAIADRGYVMRRGRLRMEGSSAELLDRFDEIEGSYLMDVSERPLTSSDVTQAPP
jgi:branched-chain amino acid transport system ATP-binding protein